MYDNVLLKYQLEIKTQASNSVQLLIYKQSNPYQNYDPVSGLILKFIRTKAVHVAV